MTYGSLAKWAKVNSAQCIGQILHRNQHPVIVPCHRIVARDGSLHGYALGLDQKLKLLESEGVEVNCNKVDLSLFGWQPDLQEL